MGLSLSTNSFGFKEKSKIILNLWSYTKIFLRFKERSGQIVQTQVRLLLEEQSDQGLHCLHFSKHLFWQCSVVKHL